ncbi:PotD/PotF family extracellular solute-binding protein [Microbacterium sp. SORGH_AS_0888]|uniref:ABC transporter substrate-binding protein n=1 Tax=Microbacterium sp. SORGH_AS_0888 TaxID=3041791 RepID=UPI002783BD7B|nr:extracellular solute-binding protein [Microbacterium sp. SORGH_AS_0888]MDQ1129297.1 putative spermidine/putrescine transport system substrate-binding protein [Microbacterium sp. SORGH_AS_0888]
MSHSPRLRRAGLAVLGLLGVAALAAGCAGGAEPSSSGDSTVLGGQVVWADYGGPTNESRQVAYFDGFTQQTGVDVVSTSIEDAVYTSMLTGDPGDYSIFQASAAEVLPNVGNLLTVPADAQGDLLPENVRPYYIGGFVFGETQGWLTATFPHGGPQSWADFFDIQKFPGKRAWPGSPGSFDASYEIALLADGVAPDDLYPLDLKRAEAKLDTIRGDLVFYQAYPEVQQLLTSGSVSIAVAVTGQFTALKNAGQDVTVQWNQAFAVPSGFVAQSGVQNKAAVDALASWMNDPKNQAVFTERTGYGPVNSKVFDELDPDVAASLVNSPEHASQILYWDTDWRSQNYEELLNSYTAWLAG